jgi:hypothetical protein
VLPMPIRLAPRRLVVACSIVLAICQGPTAAPAGPDPTAEAIPDTGAGGAGGGDAGAPGGGGGGAPECFAPTDGACPKGTSAIGGAPIDVAHSCLRGHDAVVSCTTTGVQTAGACLVSASTGEAWSLDGNGCVPGGPWHLCPDDLSNLVHSGAITECADGGP